MKLTLDTKEMTDHFFEETKLIGIMAPIKPYQFCWHINHSLHIDFRVNNELEIPMKKKGREYYFSIYEYAEPATCLVHYLYNNECDGEYLLPELKHLDFLWLLKGDVVRDESVQQLVQSLKAINGVQLVVELTNEKIKHKEHLVF